MKSICDTCQRKIYGKCPAGCLAYPKINVGSGSMLKQNYINFDEKQWKRGDLETDIFGKIENIKNIFPDNYFSEIICFHVIEHFRRTEANQILLDFYNLLKPDGKLILEAPDILGSYWYHIEIKNNPKEYINTVFGKEESRLKYGENMLHRSGWTMEIAKEEMQNVGFSITHAGIGTSHGMGKRDFRVEGIKR